MSNPVEKIRPGRTSGRLAAFVLAAAVPAAGASAADLLGLTTGDELIRFDQTNPGNLSLFVTVTGLQAGEDLVGIAYRASTGQVYGVGDTSRLYTINLETGAATQVGNSQFATLLSGTDFAVDWNPVTDQIRVVSDMDQNLRVSPVDGTAIVDTPVAFAVGDPNAAADPAVTAGAYTNGFQGAAATTLFVIDTTLNILATQNPPNDGTLTTIGALGVDPTAAAGMSSSLANGGTLLAALTVGGASNLYTINATTGAATLVAPIFNGSVTIQSLVHLTDPTDPDEDNFSSAVEVAAGTDPGDPADTPFAGAAGPATPTQNEDLARRVRVNIKFNGTNKDNIEVQGRIPVVEPFDPTGDVITFDVGGIVRSFTLDADGDATNAGPGESLNLATNVKNGSVKYTLRLAQNDFSDELADEGLTPTVQQNEVVEIPVTLFFQPAVLTDSDGDLYNSNGNKGTVK